MSLERREKLSAIAALSMKVVCGAKIILDARYWMLDVRDWILDTGCWILDTGYQMPDHRRQNNQCSFASCLLNIDRGVFMIHYPVSDIQHPVSSIQYPVSSIQQHPQKKKSRRVPGLTITSRNF
jgi:hypothetical protein